jgi:epsilon-lactone hydrolase
MQFLVEFVTSSGRFDDVVAVWRWLRTDQELSARSIAVAGDSAGGGLTVALLVATRDAGEALPAAAVLMSPTVDLVGTADLLVSDSERLAKAAAEAGVDVTLEIGEGLPHVCQIMLGTPEAAEATEEIGKFLRARLR